MRILWEIVVFFNFLKKRYKARCGHETYLTDKLTAYGESIIVTLNPNKIAHCHRCLEKMSIRCVICGKPIFVSHWVTLHNIRKNPPTYATKYEEDSYVGCSRINCSGRGLDYVGFWVQPGKIHFYSESEN